MRFIPFTIIVLIVIVLLLSGCSVTVTTSSSTTSSGSLGENTTDVCPPLPAPPPNAVRLNDPANPPSDEHVRTRGMVGGIDYRIDTIALWPEDGAYTGLITFTITNSNEIEGLAYIDPVDSNAKVTVSTIRDKINLNQYLITRCDIDPSLVGEYEFSESRTGAIRFEAAAIDHIEIVYVTNASRINDQRPGITSIFTAVTP